MKGHRGFWGQCIAALLLAPAAASALPVGNGFSFQGELQKNNLPANTTCTLQFKLYDAPSGG